MDTWADGVPSCHRGSLALRRTSSLAGPTDNLLSRSAHVDEERRRLTGAGREVDHHRREDDDDGLSENVPVLNGTEEGKEREKEEREGESGKEETREETEKREENGEEKEEGDGEREKTEKGGKGKEREGEEDGEGADGRVRDRRVVETLMARGRRFAARQTRRIVHKDGTYNIASENVTERRRRFLADIFTTLVDMRWRYCVALFGTAFLVRYCDVSYTVIAPCVTRTIRT